MDILVNNITKNYGAQKAVDHVSFQVKTGEILGFLGPNGAGKSTTMKAITCFLSPNEGDIRVGDYSIHSNPDEIKKNIGYLPENNPLYSDMFLLDYLEYIAKINGVPKDQVKERILEMVSSCGLEAEKHKKISELSKGYKQRVGLAQALIHNPNVLILDEPTTGLDPNQIVEIRELIRKIGKEKTVILSSHILAEVEATCDRILIINNGKIVADGTPAELRSQAKGQEIVKASFEGAKAEDIEEELKQIDEVERVEILSRSDLTFEIHSKPGASTRKKIFNCCVKNKWVLTELTPTETKLEDIFRELTLN